MMGVTSYDVIFIEVYIKSQLNIISLSRPLGATNCLYQQFKVQTLIHYIEGSVAQLVEHKDLKLVVMGSDPTMEEIVPSRCRLTTRHLGATFIQIEITSNITSPMLLQA